MSTGLIVLLVVVALVIIIALWLISSYNRFVKGRNKAEEAFSTMDVYLKKRFDLIPNVVETVKGYAGHEQETLEKVIQARQGISSAATEEERLAQENQLTGTLRTLFAVAEAYPDLKANTNFMNLQNQLTSIENDIANARKYYNAVVRDFNTSIESFPSNLIAGMFRFKRLTPYEVSSTEERENVKVQF
ncbi:MAG: LemA family protein [Christensenellaceae bacterium]|jgi:LemA protein